MDDYGENEGSAFRGSNQGFEGNGLQLDLHVSSSEKLESLCNKSHPQDHFNVFNKETTHSYPTTGTEPENIHNDHAPFPLGFSSKEDVKKKSEGNGELEGRDSDVHSLHLPLRETSISPQRKVSPSPERTDRDSRILLSKDHLSPHPRHTSPSLSRRSRLESSHRNDSPCKRLSTSPKRRLLSPDDRRPERSLSRSPNRQRGSSYGSRREYRDRSRSRSPIARDRYRRSPRRYSPRRRSPPGYHSRRRSPRRRPWSPPHSRNNGVGRPGNNLFVAGFSFVTTERDLERKFSRFGRVRDVRIVRDKRSGDSRGFGFLSLERDEDADAAIRALDQTEWNGRVVLVEKSKSR